MEDALRNFQTALVKGVAPETKEEFITLPYSCPLGIVYKRNVKYNRHCTEIDLVSALKASVKLGEETEEHRVLRFIMGWRWEEMVEGIYFLILVLGVSVFYRNPLAHVLTLIVSSACSRVLLSARAVIQDAPQS